MIKLKTLKWCPAIIAAVRYILQAMIGTYLTWHITVKDNWANLSDWDQINMGCLVIISGLNSLGAVMNGEWKKAQDAK